MERKMTSGRAGVAYLERNGAWLKAFIGCLILAAVPVIMQAFGPALGAESSGLRWLTFAGLVLGCFSLGYGLATAATATARIVIMVVLALVLAATVEIFLGVVSN